MWQVLLAAAAAAGSTGLVARSLLSLGAKRCEGADQNEKGKNPFDNDAKYLSPVVLSGLNERGDESNCEEQDGIFRFSSTDSGGKSGYTRTGTKTGELGAQKVKNEKRSGGRVEVSKRRVAVCLKKRKTNKNNVAAKSGSFPSKDGSLFSWGLGVGIIYMMSASKAEIRKLSTTMDETSKVVQEIKSELSRRKSPCSVQVLSSANEVGESLKKLGNKQTQQVLIRSRVLDRDLNDLKVIGKAPVDDGECTSSVLTEDRDTEALEMDQLEAELKSELQKLPWYGTEDSCHEDMTLNLNQTEVSTMGFHKLEGQSSDCYQHGVSPSELDQKLSRVLIEQQENQIIDLESELHSAHSKLREKEAELQTLKDCVRRLSKFSLSAIPDYGTEAQEEQECSLKWDCSNETRLEPRPMVGMKRPIDTESCSQFLCN